MVPMFPSRALEEVLCLQSDARLY